LKWDIGHKEQEKTGELPFVVEWYRGQWQQMNLLKDKQKGENK
jgi:hypothetical protein